MEKTHSGQAEQYSEKAKQNEQIALEEWERYRQAKDLGHEKYMERAQKCDDFYRGEQWDPVDKQKLDRQGKPALTINQIMPTVNVMIGEQITRRADIRYKPAKDGTEEVASALTKVISHELDANDFDSLESEVFADGIIQERGYYDIRIDFDENLMGRIAIESEDPGDIIPDPRAKRYDPTSWNEVTKTRWWSLDDIERDYGKAMRQRVESSAMHDRTFGSDSIRFENTFSDKDASQPHDFWAQDKSKRQIRSVRILERQFYLNDLVYRFIDPATGDAKKVPPAWSAEKRDAFASQMGLFVHKKVERRVRWRVCADKVLLKDEWSPYRSFTIVPYFPYFRRGQTVGVVTNLLSPQEFLNKISSQELHIVNSTANSGWIVESGGLSNMTTEELAQKGAETGLVIERTPGAEKPEKIQPNQIPTGLDRIGMKASASIREISGVSDAMLGSASAEVSGIALESKEKRGQVQMQVPLENLARTRRLVAKKVLELVQGFYTEPRLMKITRAQAQEGMPQQEDLMLNMPTPEGTILNDLTVGTYEVVVSSQPARDTYNDTQFAEALELRNMGIAIPDDRVVEYSNLEKKHALAEEIRELTGRGQVTEEQAQMQAMIQQMELQTMQLNVMKLDGEVRKLQAEAQKMLMEAGAIPEELQLKLAELEMKAQIEREGFEVRARLAMENSQNALEKLILANRGKQTEAMLQAALAPNSPVKH